MRQIRRMMETHSKQEMAVLVHQLFREVFQSTVKGIYVGGFITCACARESAFGLFNDMMMILMV